MATVVVSAIGGRCVVEPGRLRVARGDTITFVAHNSHVCIMIPDFGIVPTPAGTLVNRVTDIDKGQAKNVTLETEANGAPRGIFPYAVCADDILVYADPNSPPYMIIE